MAAVEYGAGRVVPTEEKVVGKTSVLNGHVVRATDGTVGDDDVQRSAELMS